MEKPLISVIIPFYNVAPFVERCARSLMEQTLQDVEFIFVDDASPDTSRKRIKSVIDSYKRNARILLHNSNKGLPDARNTGLEEALGDYIYHCDSDDYLEPTMLEDMYIAAKSQNADYVYCDFWMEDDRGRRYMATPDYDRAELMIKEGLLAGQMKYNVWNKLVKRELYHTNRHVRFPSGHSMGEDMTMIVLAMEASKVARVPKALYHYMKTNPGAFTNNFSQRQLEDVLYNTGRTCGYLHSWDTPEIDKYIAFFKLNVKLPFLLSGSREQFRLWRLWYPEANAFIEKNTFLPGRTRLVQRFARRGWFAPVWLYSIAVNGYNRLRAKSK